MTLEASARCLISEIEKLIEQHSKVLELSNLAFLKSYISDAKAFLARNIVSSPLNSMNDVSNLQSLVADLGIHLLELGRTIAVKALVRNKTLIAGAKYGQKDSQTLQELQDSGMLAYRGGNYSVAAECLYQALEGESGSWLARFYLAMSYYRIGQLLPARAEFSRIIEECRDEQLVLAALTSIKAVDVELKARRKTKSLNSIA